MLENVKFLLRVELVLLAATLVGAAVGVYIFVDRTNTEHKVSELRRQHEVAQADLEALRQENSARSETLERKRQELDQRQEETEQHTEGSLRETLPSRDQVLDLSEEVIAFATEHELAISEFKTDLKPASIASVEFPTVSYSIVANGDPNSLVGALDITRGVQTKKVEKLEFDRDQDDINFWTMRLDVLVPYREDD